jgi:DNA-binding transcriptional ArsR family regulator
MRADRANVDVFRVIADPTRRAILDRLRGGAAPVNELAADFDLSRPAVSKHLKVLKQGRLVTEAKIGRRRLYALRPAQLQKAAAWLEGYRGFWQRNLESLKRHLEET